MGIFGMFSQKNKSEKIKEYLENDAIILDVRTKAEWDEGHIEGSKHIVLTEISLQIDDIISWNKPIIAVCKSGGRSEQATKFLAQHGLDVINGGSWKNVNQYKE